MKKESLISLSLAGAIGYYLYDKLQQYGGTTNTDESAQDRTAQELSWRPEPIVEEPVIAEVFVEETIEPIVEEVQEVQEVIPEVVEEPVQEVVEETETEDDVLNPLAAFPFSEPETQIEEPVQEPIQETVQEEVYVDPTAWTCECCDVKNPDTSKFCSNCGAPKPGTIVDTPMQMIEPEYDDTIEINDEDHTSVDELFGEIEKEDEVVAPAAVVETPVVAEPVAPVVETPAFEPAPFVAPSLDDIKIEEPEFAFPELPKQEAPIAEPVVPVAPVVETPAAPAAPVEEKKLMENTEPLHKVDSKSKSAKDEYQSILDFINTL